MSDVVDKWVELYNAPEHAEREQLKARVIELEAENRKLADAFAAAVLDLRATISEREARVIELAKENVQLRDAVAKAALDVEYWRQRATRNAP